MILVPVFLLLGIWQLRRALAGNDLSWAYTFEWPLFAGYAGYLWWKLLHEELGHQPSAGTSRQSAEEQAKADEDLAAYNAYLAELNARDEPKRW